MLLLRVSYGVTKKWHNNVATHNIILGSVAGSRCLRGRGEENKYGTSFVVKRGHFTLFYLPPLCPKGNFAAFSSKHAGTNPESTNFGHH